MKILGVILLACACSGSSKPATGDGPSSDGAPGDGAVGSATCIPMCSGKTCGDDGCGGACGACAQNELCGAGGTCAAAPSGTDLVVDAAAGPHAIHPEIYGIAYGDAATLAALHAQVNRWGGNGATLYNWQLDVHNTGNDYYYENIADTGTGTYGQAGYKSSADVFVDTTRASGADVLMTIPTIGWTPKDRVGSHPFTCGFPVAAYGAQQSVDPYDSNCGNGVSASGAELAPDPSHDSMQATPAFEGQWVAHLAGVHYFQLDNEMNLWGSTHRDVHPMPVTSDEVWTSTESYAPVVKANAPGAFVLGYTTWGVLDMFVSALDTANNSTADQQAHGGVPLGRWYLRQAAAYEAAHGQRIVDCYDMHYYPQGGDPLVTTRSLWDATYHDPSWIDGWLGEPIQLLPRVKSWIATEYPGTETCISEYNFNFGDESNPAASLVEADVLGIFGAWGVRLAAYWTTPVDGSGNPLPAYRAFQIFRNYDGAGARFGDVSVGAASQLPKIAVYAAADSKTPRVLTIVIINKDTAAASPTLAIESFTPTAAAQVWRVVNNTAPARGSDLAITGGKLTVPMPASSIAMVVVP